jgi:osmotically inducible lipoprotein OsmB
MKKFIALSLIILTAGLSACTTGEKQTAGIAGGGVIGGVAGSAITGGSAVGTVAGAVGGALIGNEISKH